MKILEVTNVDFSLVQFLLPLMRALRAEGHDVVGVCADGALLDGPRAEGFRIETPPLARSFSPFAQLRALWALIRLIQREKPDMVHAHMPISGLLARVAARLCGVPCIAYTCHGFLFNQPGSRSKRLLAKVLERGCGAITDIYLTVSQEQAADAMRLRIHPNPQVIGNGRDSRAFHPDAQARQQVRAALGTPPQAVVIIIVSRLVYAKGYLELLAAMRDVPDAHLWIVGERLASDHGPTLDKALEQSSRELGPRLKRLGYRADIPALLAAADIFTLPSYSEGLPMSIIEAMLTGLPVVATHVPGPREQVVDGQTGILVPPRRVAPLAQALRQLASQPALRQSMGEAGRKLALTRYEERRVIGRTLSLLTQANNRAG
ncbi:glycosyltransferase family 4 protein [Acetobacter lovaniensis]|uniref:glycosyltransferase family 4 protein n=1 Tax=Acetobacter lovaniensis TaxID=104100 RepID=UPI00209D8337|nr:glycosyltransferase family 4 protein [Acetobacter lovaniensis]MCI1796172.1 glycosyltransferase family 4 protein [Acetobacter lovaniensis]MCP1238303.1 glycosyltransferase family 4 protein [Acetobacter lovaniensis]